MSTIDKIRQLINPNRHGGVSGLELRQAMALLDELQRELAAREAYGAERNERTTDYGGEPMRVFRTVALQ